MSARVAGTIEVLSTHRFDLEALERYMERQVEGFRRPLTAWQFRGGQSNPTYYLEAGDRQYVLRRKPPGKLLPSAEDPDVIGTPFYVMAYVPGRVLTDPRLPGAATAERAAVYDAANEVLARLHTVDWQAAGLADFGRPGNYFARQIHRWTSQYRASETETIPAMERLIAWLPEHIPAPDETTLVHGDYRLGNMIIHPTAPRVAAVLDWELSTLGHPLGDLAYHCLPFRLRHDQFEGFAGEPRPAGIPSEDEYLAAY
ncbi:MAG: phosphotransferase family protein, partial [Candidatus Rokubacteria bacterium 13_1_40CM_69_27]